MTDPELVRSATPDPALHTSVRMRDVLGGLLGSLRYEPVSKRVRATLAGEIVVDSVRAVLVWEPRRVVPGYAVPEEDVLAKVRPGIAAPTEHGGTTGFALPDVTDLPVLDPRIPFRVRSTPGTPVDVLTSRGASAHGFRPMDAALAGYVILAFSDFDEWFEEDDTILSHPHDPFARIDVRGTARHYQVMHQGQVLADTTHARILFETMLPPRYYLPMEDVRVPMNPDQTRTVCAYKGEATYYSITTESGEVMGALWQYQHPMVDAMPVSGLVAFFDERFDVVIDGELRPRPTTPWS